MNTLTFLEGLLLVTSKKLPAWRMATALLAWSITKIPGDTTAMFAVRTSLTLPLCFRFTWIDTVPAGKSNGACALICPLDT